MTRLVWTRPARDDLRDIQAYIAADSPRYGTIVVGRLVAAVRQLRAYPLSGRVVPELGRQTIREVIQGAYRIVYRVTPDAVEILTVVGLVNSRAQHSTRSSDTVQASQRNAVRSDVDRIAS